MEHDFSHTHTHIHTLQVNSNTHSIPGVSMRYTLGSSATRKSRPSSTIVTSRAPTLATLPVNTADTVYSDITNV